MNEDKLAPLHDLAARLQVEVGPPPAPEMASLTFHWSNSSASFILDDEYGDARADNPALCLALLVQNFHLTDEATGPADWARAIGWDASQDEAAAAWAANQEAREALTAALGPLPDLISALDWQLNAGLAKALRR